jgi:hypothetical protein
MNKIKVFNVKSEYSMYKECFFRIGKYPNGATALSIKSYEEGPVCTLSTNVVDDYGTLYTSDMLKTNCFFVKDYDGMPAIAKDLESKGIIKNIGLETYQGYGKFKGYEIQPKALRSIAENEVKTELKEFFKNDKDFKEKFEQISSLDKLDDYIESKLPAEELEEIDSKLEELNESEDEEEDIECDNDFE